MFLETTMHMFTKPHRPPPPCVMIYAFCRLLIFSKSTFPIFFSAVPSQCQTNWIQIRPDVLSGLIWVKSVCNVYEQTTLVGNELNNQRTIFTDDGSSFSCDFGTSVSIDVAGCGSFVASFSASPLFSPFLPHFPFIHGGHSPPAPQSHIPHGPMPGCCLPHRSPPPPPPPLAP